MNVYETDWINWIFSSFFCILLLLAQWAYELLQLLNYLYINMISSFYRQIFCFVLKFQLNYLLNQMYTLTHTKTHLSSSIYLCDKRIRMFFFKFRNASGNTNQLGMCGATMGRGIANKKALKIVSIITNHWHFSRCSILVVCILLFIHFSIHLCDL